MDRKETVAKMSLLLNAFTSGIAGLHAITQTQWIDKEQDAAIGLPKKDDQSIKARLQDVAKLEKKSIERTQAMLSLALIGMSYEFLNDCEEYQNKLSDLPEVQFLRHCRNAAFHGNKFSLRSSQPDKPAQWKGFEITSGLDGCQMIPEFIEPGDAVELVQYLQSLLLNIGQTP